MGQTFSSVWLTTTSAASTSSSSPGISSSAGMRAVLVLLVCCLISVYCELEKNEQRNLVESSGSINLERSLREAGQNNKGSRKTTRQKKSKKTEVKKENKETK